ncbi:hypothetical protein ACWT_3311 [Actinoplanes sp. SE50]|uniref:PulJ/GspJ family protein n=1 Tax=unclassified Actinoplanes TaxID=2626549 RepID=UPI00023ECE86|nr:MULTISPECIES: type II secretion system protein [unclassified Actinoplanes]AEV84334.1 hypothetical protein ACPL_3439 [Actinoplanes sp. SE50/110]ATO82726.1 hypothetical protein ACWT_3311 [Actinoplanes sp. SE50]SLM00133.1 hypothetical protein ACSP50_3365 [Actinoplanes sp. SE50/110]
MIRRQICSRMGDDSGTSLIEVMVAMGVMSVVMAIFTGGVIQFYRSADAAEETGITQTQLRLAFQTLDREVRYANGISLPATAAINGAWYVEFSGIDPAGAQVCRQLRLDAGGVLQELTWTPGSPPAAGTRGRTLASGLMSPGGSVPAPFDRQAAGSTPYASASTSATGTAFSPDLQRLRVRLTTRAGSTTSVTDVTFTALNTSRDTADPNICLEGRPS